MSILFPSNIAFAKDEVGGKLLKPVADLLLAFGDGILNIAHNVLYQMNTSIIRVSLDNTVLEIIATIAAGVAATALIATLIVLTGGAVAGLAAAIATAIGQTLAIGTLSAGAIGLVAVVSIGAGVFAGAYINSNKFGHEAVLPIYKVSPEEIFANEVGILNVNFFADMSDSRYEKEEQECVDSYEKWHESTTSQDFIDSGVLDELKKYGYSGTTADISVRSWK